jgi:galactokinase
LEAKTQFNPRHVYTQFSKLFDTEPILVRSPGRINLIGEHTDYNDGYVMPAAIDRHIVTAIDFSLDSHSTLYSVKHNEFFSFHTSYPEKVRSPLWANYILGVVRRILDKGHGVRAFNCVIDGNIPTGAGLSSSAALECSFAFALNHLHKFNISKLDLVLISQWAEHNFAGVKCGIMDQFSSVMGLEGKAFVLDCRSLEYRYFPLDLRQSAIVLCDTMVKHSLASSEYNTRRAECEEGVHIIQEYHPEVRSLRDATLSMLENHNTEFPANVYDRCTYVIQENQRVLDAAKDLEKGDLNSFGKRMYETHRGLSKLYGVSCDELDFLVDESKKINGVIGARMMGGGFGGCTVNLVSKSTVEEFIDKIRKAYQERFNVLMNTYVVSIKDGTSLINDER